MTALFGALIALGVGFLLAAAIWARRASHARKLWRASGRAGTVAIVLELEDCVRELERADREMIELP